MSRWTMPCACAYCERVEHAEEDLDARLDGVARVVGRVARARACSMMRLERLALDVLHHEEVAARLVDADVVDRHDVRVLEAADGADLVDEARAAPPASLSSGSSRFSATVRPMSWSSPAPPRPCRRRRAASSARSASATRGSAGPGVPSPSTRGSTVVRAAPTGGAKVETGPDETNEADEGTACVCSKPGSGIASCVC